MPNSISTGFRPSNNEINRKCTIISVISLRIVKYASSVSSSGTISSPTVILLEPFYHQGPLFIHGKNEDVSKHFIIIISRAVRMMSCFCFSDSLHRSMHCAQAHMVWAGAVSHTHSNVHQKTNHNDNRRGKNDIIIFQVILPTINDWIVCATQIRRILTIQYG